MDDRDNMRPGAKYFEWERKGVPLRLELGPRDVAKGQAFSKRRTGGDKFGIPLDNAVEEVTQVLDEIQAELLQRATEHRDAHTYRCTDRDAFIDGIQNTPGFYLVPWGGDDEDEDRVKDETRATLRCYPLEQDSVDGLTCPLTGKPAREWAYFARAY